MSTFTRTTRTTKTRQIKALKLKGKNATKANKTGQVWTASNRTTIRQLTKSTAPASVTYRRLKTLIIAFQTQAKRKGVSLTKSTNGRGRH